MIAVIIAVAGSGIVGCGGGRSDRVELGQDQSTAGVLTDPALARLTEPEVKVVTGVSSGRLMIGGDFEVVDDTTMRIRDDVVLVDLESGEQSELDAPTADVPVAVRAIASDGAGGFVVSGGRCGNGDALLIDGDDPCRPGNDVAFHLAAGDDRWTQLPFPDEVSPAEAEGDWSSSPRLGTLPGGGAWAFVQSTPVPTSEAPQQHLLTLTEGVWAVRGAPEGVREVCATREAFFAARFGSDTGDGGAPVALEATPVFGGQPTAVEVPEGVHGQMNGVGVHVGCSADALYLTSPAVDPKGRPNLFTYRDGIWSGQPFGEEGDLPDSVDSSPEGIFIRTFDGTDYGAYLVGGATAELQSIEDAGTSEVYLDAGAERAFIVGPVPSLVSVEAPEQEPDAVTVTIREVPLP